MNRSFQKGSPESFIKALETRISVLSEDEDVTSATNVGNVPNAPATSPIMAVEDDEYLVNLVDDVSTAFPDYSIDADTTDTDLYLTVQTDTSGIVEFRVPYADLQFNDSEADAEYIIDAIEEEIEDRRDAALR